MTTRKQAERQPARQRAEHLFLDNLPIKVSRTFGDAGDYTKRRLRRAFQLGLDLYRDSLIKGVSSLAKIAKREAKKATR